MLAPCWQRRAVETIRSAPELTRHALQMIALSAALARQVEVETVTREGDQLAVAPNQFPRSPMCSSTWRRTQAKVGSLINSRFAASSHATSSGSPESE